MAIDIKSVNGPLYVKDGEGAAYKLNPETAADQVTFSDGETLSQKIERLSQVTGCTCDSETLTIDASRVTISDGTTLEDVVRKISEFTGCECGKKDEAPSEPSEGGSSDGSVPATQLRPAVWTGASVNMNAARTYADLDNEEFKASVRPGSFVFVYDAYDDPDTKHRGPALYLRSGIGNTANWIRIELGADNVMNTTKPGAECCRHGSLNSVVPDIAARDGMHDVHPGDMCYVRDASGDEIIESGSAQYLWDGDEWILMTAYAVMPVEQKKRFMVMGELPEQLPEDLADGGMLVINTLELHDPEEIEKPSEEAPADGPSSDETSSEEIPSDESSSEEAPSEDNPSDETPSEDNPSEDVPSSDDASAGDAGEGSESSNG